MRVSVEGVFERHPPPPLHNGGKYYWILLIKKLVQDIIERNIFTIFGENRTKLLCILELVMVTCITIILSNGSLLIIQGR